MSSPFVLVVEDNETNQMLTMAVLQRDGFRVKVAGTAEEALAMIGLEGPDIILMDLQLPGQDGVTFTRALKKDRATAAIPVVAMTAHVMLGDEAQAMAAGCAGYIAKPIDTRTLSDQVRRFLGVTR
jgi:CheY-like chemotaxis protein